MDEKGEDVMARILNLCECDPDAGLEFIEQTITNHPESASDPFGKFAKAIAYGSKGLFQLARGKARVDFTGFDEEEMREDLGVTDTHLDYLEKGLQEIKEMEVIHPGALRMFGTEEDRMGEWKVDAMAVVLERCRPGRVQQTLGRTKLKYFGPRRVVYPSDLSSSFGNRKRRPPEESRVFGDVFFDFASIVRTAIIMGQGTDNRGRRYLDCMLCQRTLDDPAPGQTIGDMLRFKGHIFVFDDGTFSDALPEKRGEKDKDGAEIAEREKSEESTRTEKPPSGYCVKCHSPIPADAHYCTQCGARQ